uniref:hypothetical protein n=1 Tax=Ornithobacterium rhinotracheale TaxID=28251 RepID=UPI0039A72385
MSRLITCLCGIRGKSGHHRATQRVTSFTYFSSERQVIQVQKKECTERMYHTMFLEDFTDKWK